MKKYIKSKVISKNTDNGVSQSSSWEEKRAAMRELLSSRYTVSSIEKDQCFFCGKSTDTIYTDNGLLQCQRCRDSEISSMREAAGLLYFTYCTFKQTFCGVTFRYPDLEISKESMHKVHGIQHGDPNACGLIRIMNGTDSGFRLRIVQDIPYCFLAELYAQTFAKMLEMRGEIRLRKDGRKLSYEECVQYYLKEVGRPEQANLFVR